MIDAKELKFQQSHDKIIGQEMCFNFGLKCVRAWEHSISDYLQSAGVGPDYNPHGVRSGEKYGDNFGGNLCTHCERYRAVLGDACVQASGHARPCLVRIFSLPANQSKLGTDSLQLTDDFVLDVPFLDLNSQLSDQRGADLPDRGPRYTDMFRCRDLYHGQGGRE